MENISISFETSVIIIGIIVLLYYMYNNTKEYFNTSKVCNRKDKRCYKVSNDYEDSDEASDILGELNVFANELMRNLRRKYVFGNQGSEYRISMVKYLLHNYNPDNILENVPKTIHNTSYVQNKGEKFGMCLREREEGTHDFHDLHLLQFVMLHEMAHLASFGYQHGEEFWRNFKILLIEANEIGIHTPVDYSTNPINYCGLHVDYNVFFDETVDVY